AVAGDENPLPAGSHLVREVLEVHAKLARRYANFVHVPTLPHGSDIPTLRGPPKKNNFFSCWASLVTPCPEPARQRPTWASGRNGTSHVVHLGEEVDRRPRMRGQGLRSTWSAKGFHCPVASCPRPSSGAAASSAPSRIQVIVRSRYCEICTFTFC